MAVVARVASLTLSGATGGRTWTATASAQDIAAGGTFTVTVAASQTGGGPPTAATALTLDVFVDDTQTSVGSFNVLALGATTLSMRSNMQANGTARSGTVRLRLRAQQTGGPGTSQYDVNSDNGTNGSGTGTNPTGFTVTASDQGWVRGTTTAAVTILTRDTIATAAPTLFAHPHTPIARVVIGAVPFISRSVNATFDRAGGGAGSQMTSAAVSSATGTYDLTFSQVNPTNFIQASSSSWTVNPLVSGNATLTGLPWTVFTSTTTMSKNVDPRLTRTPLFQLNDDTHGTPPMVKDVPDHKRKNTEIGYLGSRTTNALGEGVNGVTYTATLAARGGGGTLSQSGLVTTTRGGEDGWNPTFLQWLQGLPEGFWDKTVAITSPAGYTGSFIVQNGSTEYVLVAPNPDLKTMLNVQHEPGLGGRHFSNGMALIPTAYLTNLKTGIRIPASAITSAKVAVIRAATAANSDGTGGSWEYLDATLAWNPWAAAEARHAFDLTASTADTTTFEKRFATDSTWGLRDMRFVVVLEYNGVFYPADYIVVNVAGKNLHDTPDIGPLLGLPI